jgi:hypothetical protein
MAVILVHVAHLSHSGWLTTFMPSLTIARNPLSYVVSITFRNPRVMVALVAGWPGGRSEYDRVLAADPLPFILTASETFYPPKIQIVDGKQHGQNHPF